ncbi:FAD/NAD(P)-binding protein [Pelagerythrobacter sp.]|uniref:FAD/NAD(P)-binding protein n=1 Tax=Pelagerythrobacter sp. TaxID=2800702 RepID=UPI0035B019B2
MLSHVAIVGGGFSGTLQAINLLRHDGPRATLIERRDRAGEGLAYGEAAPSHVLNVRAAGMNALPDEPDSFARWLASKGLPFAADSFAPRLVYGAYLRDLLDQEMARQPGRLELVRGEATSLEMGGDVRIALDRGGTVRADIAILAVGNLPPHHPRGLSADLAGDLYAADPWTDAATAGLTSEDTVLVLGTGLTMVDMVLRLDAEGFGGRIVAMSRRGLLPHRHDTQPPFAPIEDRPVPQASALVRHVRGRASEVGWRNAVDELRRFTAPLWRAADDAGRARFLRHLRPWWDIHRHRIAPAVADRLNALMAEGRLTVIAGKTCGFAPGEGHAAVTLRRRGNAAERTIEVRRVINCTGPQGDLGATREPLLQQLTRGGVIRPDPLRIGIDVDAQSHTIGASGRRNERLYAIGPMTRGASWEIVAVPDIRVQVWALARRLSNAHWVGGEGL